MKKVDRKLYCTSCRRETNHYYMSNKDGVPLEYTQTDSDFEEWEHLSFKDEYYIVSCMGCDRIAFLNIYGDESMFTPTGPNWNDREYIQDYKIYPEAPISEDMKFYKYDSPYKFKNLPVFIGNLRKEVITAFEEDMGLLCGMGIRMLVEAICKEKGITQTQVMKKCKPVTESDGTPKMRNLSLFEKIETLKDRNIIDEAQKQVLHQVRNMGNDTAHEIKTHGVRILKQALHVVEFILYNIYELPNITITNKP
ncbi:DUF4145 domain-containing protein [Bacillus cereus]|uniref:DUF4145 domain-containing protein n=1 Tax=Bacillus cereus TaxID=1396 RepID=UPI0037FB7B7B